MENIVFDYVYYSRKENGSVAGYVASTEGVEWAVPLDPANRHYAEIMRQVEAGELIITPAEEE